jgi:hemolysin D
MKSANATLPARQAQVVVPFRTAKARSTDELAFLPAALEIVETPPSPIGRAIAAVLIALF